MTTMPDPKAHPSAPSTARPALAEVFTAEEAPLLRYAFGLTGRRAAAEEVVQDAFFRLHKQRNEVRQPKPWLYRCARNLALNSRRDTSREVSVDPTNTAHTPDDGLEAPDKTLGRLEAVGTVRLLVAELPEEDARLLHLKYNEHLTYSAIAVATGQPIGTVGYKLHHLLKGLAAALRRAGIESPEG